MTATETDTILTPSRLHAHTAPLHLLAQARVRSLAARPVGPMKVRRVQQFPTHRQ
ncbi:hypothetical protein ACRQ4B_15305 [Curtobacterium sp. SP.BCo]|uniref:hypothetical protein n=1 Tax=Curtobacterium sp. SP.BCo TaxID=3435229 RepID=UPI003F73982D